MNSPYASGDWMVGAGSEEEFVKRWTEFLEWTRAAFSECRAAHLIQEAQNPRHFISFASWDSADALQRWRSRPEFAQKMGACRALCEDFRGGDYGLAAAV
jgi:quinol monooxygenase YgiN